MQDFRDNARKRRELRRSKLRTRPMMFFKVVHPTANMDGSFDAGDFVNVNCNGNRKRRFKESSSCDTKEPCIGDCQERNYSTVPDRGETPFDGIWSDQSREDREEPRSLTSHGLVSVIGRRRAMEDAVAVAVGEIESFDFFGVYDGHGGSRVSDACRDRMHRLVAEEVPRLGSCGAGGFDYWKKVLVACFARMDEEVGGGSSTTIDTVAAAADSAEDHESAVRETATKNVGSTALVVMVGKEEIVVANCGDSRVVLCRDGISLPLSRDHKPDRPDEKDRVEAAGGRVLNWNGCRVLGVLATSRSIGDEYLKPYVISEPEVTVSKRMELDDFLVIASDGLWDVVSNEIACEVVKRCLDEEIKERFSAGFDRDSAAEAAAILAELAMARGSKDNISVIVVDLKNLTPNIT